MYLAYFYNHCDSVIMAIITFLNENVDLLSKV